MGDADEQMSIPGVSTLFADDNWNWPCLLDLLSPGTVHFTSGNRGGQRGQGWAGQLGNDNGNVRWEGGPSDWYIY